MARTWVILLLASQLTIHVESFVASPHGGLKLRAFSVHQQGKQGIDKLVRRGVFVRRRTRAEWRAVDPLSGISTLTTDDIAGGLFASSLFPVGI